ncbi:MAG: hypothetical protein JRI87_01030 [Deltaproteobacteria bacterium]|jgi:hypothetical protein|nr:hypothetical protein [Deltaproteobacteria bacterium]
MGTSLEKETLKSDRNQLREGQRVLYEGKEAEVIAVKPMIILKFKDRIICGSISGRIEIINGSND